MISFADFAFSSHFLVMLLSLAVSCSRELLRTFTWYQTSPPGLASGHLGSFLGFFSRQEQSSGWALVQEKGESPRSKHSVDDPESGDPREPIGL